MKRFVIGICAVLTCGSALAGALTDFTEIDSKLKACLAENGSTPWVNNCNAAAKTAADKRLNLIYDAWVDRLKHPTKEVANGDAEILRRLVAAERAWIDYRDRTAIFKARRCSEEPANPTSTASVSTSKQKSG